jgi:hypothetical protein
MTITILLIFILFSSYFIVTKDHFSSLQVPQNFSNEPLNTTLKSSGSPLAPALPFETWCQKCHFKCHLKLADGGIYRKNVDMSNIFYMNYQKSM